MRTLWQLEESSEHWTHLCWNVVRSRSISSFWLAVLFNHACGPLPQRTQVSCWTETSKNNKQKVSYPRKSKRTECLPVNMASTLAQRYKEQITRPIHRTKALKGEKQEDHFQDVVGVSFRCRSGKRRFLQTVLTKLIIEESSRDTFLSCSNKKNLFVDYFHFLLGPLPW